MYRDGSPTKDFLKVDYTYDISDLTVIWIITPLYVLLDWFWCTDDVNDPMSIFYTYGENLSRHMSLTPDALSNHLHLIQLIYFLD